LTQPADQLIKATKKGNSYFCNSKKNFNTNINVDEFCAECARWAYDNTFNGHFKKSGRSLSTILVDSLVGKIGEFIVYKFLVNRGYSPSYPDLSVRGYGEWDDGDMILDGKKLSIKTSTSGSNFLRLKRSDWDNAGNYLYGKSGIDDSYKAIFYCRIKPNIRKILTKDEYLIEEFIEECSNITWGGEVSGFVKKEDLIFAIKENMVFEKSSLIDGKMPAFFDQIYFQIGCLRDANDIPRRA